MKSLLIIKHAGHLIPEAYLKLAVKHHDRALGMSYVDKNEGDPMLTTCSSDITAKVDVMDVLLKTQEELKESGVVFHLFGGSGGFQDDIQPFEVLKDEKKNVLLTAFAAGNFDHHLDGSKHPGEFMVYGKYLLPILNEMYNSKEVGRDLGKLLAAMDTVQFKAIMENLYRDHGAIIFHSITDELKMFGKSVYAKQFDWGKVTTHFDYTEGAVATAKSKIKGFFGKSPKGATSEVPPKQEVAKAAQSEGDKSVETKPVAKGGDKLSGFQKLEEKAANIVATTEKPVVGVKVAESGPRVKAHAPHKYKTGHKNKLDKHSVKKWYEFCSTSGVAPREYKSFPTVDCWERRIKAWDNNIRSIKGFEEVAHTLVASEQISAAADNVKPADAPKGKDTAAAIGKQKDLDTKHVGKKPEENVQEHKVPETLPIIPADGKKAFADLRRTADFAAVLDTSSRKIKSPDELRAMEAKIPSAFQQLGLKRSQVRNLGPDEWLQIAHLCGADVVAILAFSLSVENQMLIQRNPNDVDGYLGEAGAIPEQEEEAPVVEAKKTTAPTGKVLHPVKQEAAPAKKGGLFAKLQKKAA